MEVIVFGRRNLSKYSFNLRGFKRTKFLSYAASAGYPHFAKIDKDDSKTIFAPYSS